MSRPNTSYTTEIVCPYCAHEFSDSYELIDSDGDEVGCDNCDKLFTLSVDHGVTYSTKRIDCGDDTHDWQEAESMQRSQYTADRYNAEAFCRRTDWTPATIWMRSCNNCDDTEYAEVEVGGPNPWEKEPAP